MYVNVHISVGFIYFSINMICKFQRGIHNDSQVFFWSNFLSHNLFTICFRYVLIIYIMNFYI